MRHEILALIAVPTLVVCASLRAQPADAARAELEQGYELRKEDRCKEAIAHLRASQRLEPQLKTLINLADCEERVGKLVDAQLHWIQAREQATRDGDARVKELAERRLGAVASRVAKVVLRLANDAPATTEVAWDGVPLAGGSLGAPFPADPGKHVAMIRAEGREDGKVEVELAEGEQKDLEVRPGAAVAQPPHAPPAVAQSVAQSGGVWRTAGLLTAGAGVVGLGLGAFFGVRAIQKQNDANCPGNVCRNAADEGTVNDAIHAGNLSTALFVAGGVLTAGGLAMFFLAPKDEATTQRAWHVAPALGRGGPGATLQGTF